LIVWVRREVEEPSVWKEQQASAAKASNPFAVLFSKQYLARTLLATMLTSSVLYAYWGLFFWMPTFLAEDAGLSLTNSLGWIVPTQIGAFFGYLSFGFLAERFGRRPTFIAFVLSAAVLVPIYGHMARDVTVLFVLSPLLGFVGHGYFSVFGAMLAELFPTEVRATGQGMTYNCGRVAGALGPYTIGALGTKVGIGPALAVTSIFFLLGAVLIFFLPDTSRQELSGESPPPAQDPNTAIQSGMPTGERTS
jgi:MFS family permease